jgi:hypothetical protein
MNIFEKRDEFSEMQDHLNQESYLFFNILDNLS